MVDFKLHYTRPNETLVVDDLRRNWKSINNPLAMLRFQYPGGSSVRLKSVECVSNNHEAAKLNEYVDHRESD